MDPLPIAPKLFSNADDIAIPVPPEKAAQEKWILDETINDVSSSTYKYIFRTSNRTTLILLYCGLGWMLIVALVAFFSGGDMAGALAFMLIPPAMAYGVFVWWTQNKIRHEFYQQFALANKFSYQPYGSPALDGALFNLGHSRKTEDLILGTHDGNPLTLFNYSYITGSGKNQQTHHDTVFIVEYPSVLTPILLLTSHQFYGDIFGVIQGWEKLKPQDDFDKKFTLYCQKGLEIEALEIFTPEFMAKLLGYPEFNLEFRGRKIIIFHNMFISGKAELQRMYEFVQFLITTIDPLAKRMEGSVKAMEDVEKII